MPPLGSAQVLWLAAGCTMLHALWVGGLIGLFARTGRRLLRPAALRIQYSFTLVCLLVLLAAPATLFVRVIHRMQAPAATVPAEVDADGTEADPALLEGEVWTTGGGQEALSTAGSPASQPGWMDAVALLVTPWSAVLPWVWGGGTAVALALLASGLGRARRLRREARLLHDEPAAVHCDRLVRRLGVRKVQVAVSDQLASPLLIGIRHPVILLPAEVAETWRSDQLEMVLLHELWHVRRRDNLVNLLQCVVESVMFFHPAVWRISHWLRIDRENCCDSAVLRETREPLAYAELLAALAVGQNGRGRLALPMGEHNLVERIRHVLGREPRSGHRLGTAVAGVVLAVTACSASAVLCLRSEWLVVPVLTNSAETAPAVRDAAVGGGWRDPLRVASAATRSPQSTVPAIADGITLQVVDGAGNPVAGARAGIRVKWSDEDSDWPNHSAPFAADGEGVIRITMKKLVEPVGPGGCDPLAPCYVYDEGRGLAGVVNLSLEDWGRTRQVVLQPAARLQFALAGPDPPDGGEPVAWTKGFVRLPGNRLSYLLRKTQPELSTFEYLLPPGSYELVAMAGTGPTRASVIHVHCFAVPAGSGTVDLGAIKLEPAPQRDHPDGAATQNAAPVAGVGGAAGFGATMPPASESKGPWWEN